MAKKNGNNGNGNGNHKGETLTPYQLLTADFVVAVLTSGAFKDGPIGGEALVKGCADLAEQVLALEPAPE
jgi:hypothetical protein